MCACDGKIEDTGLGTRAEEQLGTTELNNSKRGLVL